MIKKILIANRGEIACRIIRSAKQLGITTVAIFSDIDSKALHVLQADEAYFVGEAPSQNSYLNISKIIEIAKKAKIDAIHPGYGFLSENADFAKACEENHIIFIGPTSKVIELMGDKQQAKQVVATNQLPVIPGYHGDNQELPYLLQEAKKIGFPLLIKASAGGGGKGMRLVTSEKDLKNAIESAKREAKSSFNDDKLIIEKYIINGRHIETQILGDHHGNVLYLQTRDCSIQRRHQKIIEEAPAPNLPAETSQAIATAAIQIAKLIHYRNAGTIEFLMAPDNQFYFMEMNTRLQVEHPITEMICNIDLVAWQIRIADNAILSLPSESMQPIGHAIEARIYAEDPNQNFIPVTGRLEYLRFPEAQNNIRIETGVIEKDEISVYYDPLIAKLIVWDTNRELAIKKLQLALQNTYIAGLTTNLSLLYKIAQHPQFSQANISTDFIQQFKNALIEESQEINVIILMAASFAILHQQKKCYNALAKNQSSVLDPWLMHDGWRDFQRQCINVNFWFTQEKFSIKIKQLERRFLWQWQEQQHEVKISWHDKQLQLILQNQIYAFTIIELQQQIIVFYAGQSYSFSLEFPSESLSDLSEANGLTAIMPSIITKICVNIGDKVQKGDPLMITEAMKMEHTIHAPYAGLVQEIYFHENDRVNANEVLMSIQEQGSQI